MALLKKVLITGGTRGLGRAMVDEFIQLSHTVVACGRSKVEIAELQKMHGKPHLFTIVDVTSNEAVQHWAEQVIRDQGAPELLLNNAAVINRNAPLWEVSAEDFSKVIDINVKGTANVIRHFVPPMIREGRGVIVNFSSGWGRSVDAEVAPYCASKWAIEGLTLALAQELPEGMAAIPLNPGVINTDMLQSCFGASAAGHISLREWAKKAVPFLLKLGPRDNGKQMSV